MEQRPSLGEILVRSGLVGQADIDRAVAHQSNQPVPRPRLGEVVVELGMASEADVASAVAERYGLEFSDLEIPQPDRAVLLVVPRRLAVRGRLVPVRFEGEDGLVIAMADPTNVVAVDDVRMISRASRVSILVAPASAVTRAVAEWYRFEETLDTAASMDSADADLMASVSAQSDDVESMLRQADQAPIVRMVADIQKDAVRAGATDIHIEPTPRGVRVRYRVDGMLRDVLTLPRHAHGGLVSRMKILSGMDIAERRRPQDGRSTLRFEGREFDLRMATIPTPSGERVAIRVLPQGDGQPKLAELGMESEDLSLLERHLERPHGMVVFTGPPGSGKSTAMYASLARIRGPERSLLTIEDPIESQLPWATQVQVDERVGITFAHILRAALRQDPNVVLLGEIRDKETAVIATQAAMTGMLMLTTLHTVDSPSAVVRLIDLGLEPFVVASSLSAVVAQRLVRRICDRCREPGRPSDSALRALGLKIDEVGETTVGAGCQACAHTGFKGRVGLYEILTPSAEIRDRMVARASAADIGELARQEGLRTLRERGIQKALAGVTTFEEIARVTYAERESVATCRSCARPTQPEFMVCPYCATPTGPRAAA